AWNGWKQTQDGVRRDSVTIARDATVQQVSAVLASETRVLEARLASAEVQAALQAGDFAAAGRELAKDWPLLEHAQVQPQDLSGAYGGAADSGFGRVAAMEAALAAGSPAAWIVRDDGKPALALTAPARVGEATVGVAFARLPLSRVTQ